MNVGYVKLDWVKESLLLVYHSSDEYQNVEKMNKNRGEVENLKKLLYVVRIKERKNHQTMIFHVELYCTVNVRKT